MESSSCNCYQQPDDDKKKGGAMIGHFLGVIHMNRNANIEDIQFIVIYFNIISIINHQISTIYKIQTKIIRTAPTKE